MTAIAINLNGRRFEADVSPRTQLAELLRDKALLTGTHLGCEHGICGACTVLVDGAPARACITYAVACDGADVVTVEGLDDDPLAAELRAAFREQHALQCGFCTPGMLITARDIVARLPGADSDRIRLELAGNLCRCTGYLGVIQAVKQVVDARGEVAPLLPAERLGPVGARPCAQAVAPPTPIATTPETVAKVAPVPVASAPTDGPAPQHALARSLAVTAPVDAVWAQFADVVALSRCLPGAEFGAPDAQGVLHGRLHVKFGPVRAAFEASARQTTEPAERRGRLVGQGRDRLTGTRVTAEIAYALHAADADTRVDIEVRYGLSGRLAQFARGALAERFADRLTADFAYNLERLLAGAPPDATAPAADGLWARLLKWLRLSNT
ncbi:2Fe-2S iron-sulfur cluster-binding protein [Acidihalobacter prosperus]|uniref:Carbon monoxide dehydrogenase small chain n=1 Tax=Acidihalobacter prosperus TaxID=160660 RepID=A0A1A6C6N4_9GAMM|nr:2Fe-2S iron-sulfur cluster-binding protein [Acidihalobacter prosperus]OBS10221.1 Carbon monoxide dehydrogenase small chain [Acidihalobacter prosperus]